MDLALLFSLIVIGTGQYSTKYYIIIIIIAIIE